MPESWRVEELDLLAKYFSSNMTELNLYYHLNNLNPGRTYEAMTRQIRRWRAKGFTRSREDARARLRVGYLDIEATNLNADFGMMLCWYIKAAGTDTYYSSCVTSKEMTPKGVRDKRVVGDLLDAMQNFDVLYAHYGSDRRFDFPYIRTRALKWNYDGHLTLLKNNKFIRDTWLISRNKLKLSRNSLANIAKFLGLTEEKTALDPSVWNDAMLGCGKALEYVDVHCKADVDVLEAVHGRLKCVEKETFVGF